MPWLYLIPLGLLILSFSWYRRTGSLTVAGWVGARLAVVLLVVWLATRIVWYVMVPRGVCPITTPLPVLILSILVPLILLAGLTWLASYAPQLIETHDGFALLAGEDVYLKRPFQVNDLGNNRYRFQSGTKVTTLPLRGQQSKRVMEQITLPNTTDRE